MTSRTVVFTTSSGPEAALVVGLLDAEGLSPVIERSPLRSVFPIPVAFFGQLRVAVPPEEAGMARQLLERFETPVDPGPRVVPLRDDLAPLVDDVSDHLGRKPIIMTGLFGLSLSMYSFGLSKTYWGAVLRYVPPVFLKPPTVC